MRKALRTIWSYILAFTVDLKKTARVINEIQTTDELKNKTIGGQHNVNENYNTAKKARSERA